MRQHSSSQTFHRQRGCRQPGLCLPLLLLAAACGAVPGTSTYGCGGLPEGVSCVSARDVYKLTNSGKPVVAIDGKATALDAAPAGTGATTGTGAPGPVPMAADSAQPNPTPPVSAPVTTDRGASAQPGVQSITLRPEDAGAMNVVPLRTPSRVLRIWIAPWEDEAGRLHVPGFTYAEIEPRRWSIGENQPGRGMRLKPLPAPPGAQPQPRAQGERAGEPELQDAAGDGPSPRHHARQRPQQRRQADGDAEEIRFNSFTPAAPAS